jgi:hypothetical protein
MSDNHAYVKTRLVVAILTIAGDRSGAFRHPENRRPLLIIIGDTVLRRADHQGLSCRLDRFAGHHAQPVDLQDPANLGE